MNSRILLVLVILIVVAAGGWYLVTQNSSEPTTNTTTNGSNTTPPPPPSGTDVGMEDGTGGTDVSVDVNTQGYDALMAWTDSGYNPQTLTIKRGQTVRFVNQGTGDTWPASDIHPTHSLYPQKSASDCLGSSFDACKGLKPGQFYDFKFDTAGTWNCHNHLRANQKCSIVVQ